MQGDFRRRMKRFQKSLSRNRNIDVIPSTQVQSKVQGLLEGSPGCGSDLTNNSCPFTHVARGRTLMAAGPCLSYPQPSQP